MMRDRSVDISKGIGILLMVVGHSGAPEVLVNFIYAFHMPLFFILSGFCFKNEYLNDKRTFVKHRISGIYFPYVRNMLFFLCLHNLFYVLRIYEDKISIVDFCREAFYIVFLMNGWEPLLGGYWFLTQLFLASIIGILLFSLIKRIDYIILICFLIALFLSSKDIKIPHCPISDVSFKSLLFFFVGVKLKKMNVVIGAVPCIFVLIGVFISSFVLKTGMLTVSGLNWLLYSAVAISGTFSIMFLSRKLSRFQSSFVNLLSFLGERSMSVLTWHFFGFKFISLLAILIYGYSLSFLSNSPVISAISKNGWWFLYSIAGVAFPILMQCCFSSIIKKIIRCV